MSEVAGIVGYVVICAIVAVSLWLALEILLNIYWGIVGAFRLRGILIERNPEAKITIWATFKHGFTNWLGGHRFDGSVGSYWQIDEKQVPLDGRSKVYERWPG